MSGSSSSSSGTYDTTLSDAYAKGGASASQVQAIRDREIAHQDSVRSGGNGYYSTSSGNASSLIPSVPSTIVDKYNGNDYGGLSYSDLLSGNFGKSYITGNSLAANKSINNAQKAMIQSNYYAKQAGNESPYSLQQITDAANGGYTGNTYSPGRSSYSYVTPYQTGGQNWISPTMRTDGLGLTTQYKGYANEPLLGSYARGVSTPQEMNYSWERTLDPLTGSYAFNSAGATAAAARDLTLALAPVSNVAKVPVPSANSTLTAANALIPLTSTTTPTWQQRLEIYKTDMAAGNAEIARAQQVYNEKIKAGDYAGAEAAHQWAKQIREAMGVANQYDSVTGAPLTSIDDTSLMPTATTSTAPLTPDPVAKLTEMIQNVQAQQAQAPIYNPYQQREFQYTAPSYSITSNPADTSFIPTAKAKDRWQQQEQANADEAYKGYSSQYNAYQQGYKATQDAIANALSLLPYSEMTAAQKATVEQQKAQDALQYEIDKAKADIEAGKWTNSDEYAQLQANLLKAQTAKALRDAHAPYSSGGGGNKPMTATQIKASASTLVSGYLKNHKRPIDVLARINKDIESGAISASVGQAARELLTNIYSNEDAMKTTLSTWKK